MTSKRLPNPIDVHVGNRVRLRRMMLDMSQQRLADEIGLTFQQVQKYEKGINRMGASRLQQIANALQVPVTFFFDAAPGQTEVSGEASSSSYVAEFLATSDGLALTKAFMQIKNSKLRRKIVEVVNEVADQNI